MKHFVDTVDALLARIESRSNLATTSVLVGLILLLASSLYVMPRFEVSYHGIGYRQLAEDPFNFSKENPLQFRILTPLIAYILRIPSAAYFCLPLFFAILFLGAIYYWYRKQHYSPAEALGMSGLIAFSSTIFIPLISPGYTDIVSYFLVFLSFVTVTNKKLFIPLFCAALFNHEMALFLLPALFAFSVFQSEDKLKECIMFVISAAVSCAPYFFYRYYVGQHANIEYNFEFYASMKNVQQNFKLVARLTPVGAFFAFKLYWFIVLYFLSQSIYKKKFDAFLPVALLLLFTFLQLLFAYDITRLFSIAFMAILLSADYLRTNARDGEFRYHVWTLIALNFFIPQYFVSQEGLNDMFPPVVYLFEYILKLYI